MMSTEWLIDILCQISNASIKSWISKEFFLYSTLNRDMPCTWLAIIQCSSQILISKYLVKDSTTISSNLPAHINIWYFLCPHLKFLFPLILQLPPSLSAPAPLSVSLRSLMLLPFLVCPSTKQFGCKPCCQWGFFQALGNASHTTPLFSLCSCSAPCQCHQVKRWLEQPWYQLCLERTWACTEPGCWKNQQVFIESL